MKYTKFIPTFMFNTRTEKWEEINEERENWLNDNDDWCQNKVKSISIFLEYTVMVIFNEPSYLDYNHMVLYQGELE